MINTRGLMLSVVLTRPVQFDFAPALLFIMALHQRFWFAKNFFVGLFSTAPGKITKRACPFTAWPAASPAPYGIKGRTGTTNEDRLVGVCDGEAASGF
ncbi:MAG: hypothetical protein DRH32_05160 [Deltaproteobacteria bacterium]|nr:MAG: hypothetical protein DRH32_05160 [Deltaproteobacteria bacterium]